MCSPGSRIWKVGFSSEVDPRGVFWVRDRSEQDAAGEMWDLGLDGTQGVDEAKRVVEARIIRSMRRAFTRCVVPHCRH